MKAALPVMLLMLATAGCQTSNATGPAPGSEGSASMVRLEGNATYRQRIALPPDAVLIVRIQDVSRMDAPARLIAEQRLPTQGRQVPLPFAVDYDPAQVQSVPRVAVSARIEDGAGTLLWITDTHIPLPPAGQRVDLPLVQVSR